MKKILSFALAICTSFSALAQTHVVNGRVVVMNDLPVANLSISAKKSGTTTKSDSTGNFSIVCNDKDELVFTSKVFDTQKIKVSSKTRQPLVVKLKSPRTRDAVDKAIGYGYISEDNRTTATTYIDLNYGYGRFATVGDAISATVSNVQVNGDCVIIRGVGSPNGTQCAMIIIDGIESSSFNNIPTSQVKRIDVLKDAASSSIYGVRASNGVILIETFNKK